MDRAVQRLCMAGRMPATLWLLVLIVAASPLVAQNGPAETTGQAVERGTAAAANADGPAPDGDDPWPFPETPAGAAPEVSLAGLLLRVGIGLSFVVGLAWGCVFLLKKSALGQQLAPSTSGIRILERSFLAPKRAIYVVEIGDRALALGVTENSINVLSRWPADQLQLPERKFATGGFAAQLRSFLSRGEEADTPQGAPRPEVGA